MKLKLERDMIILDFETTGLSPKKDRIIQIGMIKIFADEKKAPEKKKYFINPERPIPQKVTDITGITNEMVKDAPTFRQLSKGILSFIGKCDLCGFNSNRFDIPFLIESLFRCDLKIDFTDRRYVDVKRIYHRMEPRDLRAAYRKFVGKNLDDAHDALIDVQATVDVLEAMLDSYKDVDCIEKDDTVIKNPVRNDIQALFEFTKDFNELDWEGWVKLNEQKVPVFGKGKYQDQSIGQICLEDKGYYKWLMSTGDFTNDTRTTIEKVVNDYIKSLANVVETENHIQ